jgi:diaminohydroxyphosphoribosylaminopyrimidine deaminase/5-amino-6-(5-phosphoribosylamino)uracil reductase
MQRCLELAKLGAGNVAPNPMVGAILVNENRIIGEGYHEQYGKAHAEVNCINSVKDKDRYLIEKSTLYVSLEPCVHYGKTPPCADLIITNKIPNVFIGCRDSYEEVNGKGIEKLKAAGVNVVVEVVEKEALDLNKRFFTFHTKHRPYIILKWAQSKDGKIANADHSRVFISNEETNRLVHKWRSEEASILVGTNTALYDDPALTTRLWPGNNPVRLVIDKELKLPQSLQLFDGKVKTIVFNKLKHQQEENILYYQVKDETNNIKEILAALYKLKIQSVIVEGGTKLLQSFIDIDMWDEARVIVNNELLIGNGIAAPLLKGEELISEEIISNNIISYCKKK